MLKENSNLQDESKIKEIWKRYWNDIPIDDHAIFDNNLDAWTGPHKEILDKYLLRIQPGSCVLNLGCGLGKWVFYCYRKHFFSVGIDIVHDVVARLNDHIKNSKFSNRIKFIEDDIFSLKEIKDNSCDMILSFGVLEHVKDDKISTFFSNCNRILKKGGYVIITVPNLYSFLTLTKNISRLLGLWKVGRHKHYSLNAFRKIVPLNKFQIIEEGTLNSSELFGSVVGLIPLVGPRLLNNLRRLSMAIESRSNTLGFMRFIVLMNL